MTANLPVSGLNHEQVKLEDELPPETAWSEEHDCVPLKQRLKMLRAAVLSRSREDITISARSPVEDSVKKDDNFCESLGSEQIQHGKSLQEGTLSHLQGKVLSERLEMEHNVDTENSEEFLDDLDHVVLKERLRMLISREVVGSSGRSDISGISSPIRKGNDDMVEKHDESVQASINESQNYKIVKAEPLDDDLLTPNKDVLHSQISVKSEPVNSAEILEDIIDHMILGDRIRLLASEKFPNFEKPRAFTSFGNEDNYKPSSSESSKPFLLKRPRKRKKTATDSIETALEEDAPGLLQVLIEKGVMVDEIKLYGENENDEASDIEESFSELEDVIEKLFSQRQSFLKFAPIRCGKGEKASYCLACLISLVEQARYLRVRKWPIEWGWCRDLQSFIFIFEKHNRIVLERPEYGYATYFFELVDALPVKWQIKRLVTAMKLTSCSRITLIENRPLTVGNDLSEGEARVLMEYGWIPNSGLGTMLNYRDRVVHDRKNESESSEWRSKIGKLLMDGIKGGVIVPNDIPKKVMDYDFSHCVEIKMEE